MKMVCKKLLSLVLVALMLVSAVPFQASAAGAPAAGKTVDVILNDKTSNFDSYQSCTLDENGKIKADDIATIRSQIDGKNIVAWSLTPGDSNGQGLGDIVFTEDNFGGANAINLYPVFGSSVTPPPTTEHTEHPWGNGTVSTPATCTTKGTMTYTCTYENCGATKTEEIPATGHTFGDPQITTPATCGKDGSQTKTCSACGATETEVIKATGNHTWGGWVIQNEATATTEGTMIRTCSTCGQTETQKYTAKTKEISFQVTLDGETTTTKSVFVLDKTMSLPKPSVPSGYQFKGWFTEPNGKGAQLNDGTTCTENLANVYYGSFTKVSKFPYSVYLHIYETGNVKTPMKTVTLDTWTCVKDGVVTLDEIKEVVKTYYTAKTSDGIAYDGIYYSTSSTKTDYVNDQNKTDRINNLDELRRDGYVHLNVWVDNVKAKSDSNSNTSSNPKTGDTIYMAVTVMGLSAASLAAVYYISKKRAVR